MLWVLLLLRRQGERGRGASLVVAEAVGAFFFCLHEVLLQEEARRKEKRRVVVICYCWSSYFCRHVTITSRRCFTSFSSSCLMLCCLQGACGGMCMDKRGLICEGVSVRRREGGTFTQRSIKLKMVDPTTTTHTHIPSITTSTSTLHTLSKYTQTATSSPRQTLFKGQDLHKLR